MVRLLSLVKDYVLIIMEGSDLSKLSFHGLAQGIDFHKPFHVAYPSCYFTRVFSRLDIAREVLMVKCIAYDAHVSRALL